MKIKMHNIEGEVKTFKVSEKISENAVEFKPGKAEDFQLPSVLSGSFTISKKNASKLRKWAEKLKQGIDEVRKNHF